VDASGKAELTVELNQQTMEGLINSMTNLLLLSTEEIDATEAWRAGGMKTSGRSLRGLGYVPALKRAMKIVKNQMNRDKQRALEIVKNQMARDKQTKFKV
jgi:hypothetical protein